MEEIKNKDEGEVRINKGGFAIIIIALLLSLCGNAYLYGVLNERNGKCVTEYESPVPPVKSRYGNDIPDEKEDVDHVFKNDKNDIFTQPLPFEGKTTPNDGYRDEDFEYNNHDTNNDYNTDNVYGSEGYGYMDEEEDYNTDVDEYLTPEEVPEETSEGGFLDIIGQAIDTTEINENLPKGVLVMSAPERGAYKEAGGDSGDIIIDINGERIVSVEDIRSLLSNYNPGDSVEVTFYNEAQEGMPVYKTIIVKLTDGHLINHNR